eukprot:scaffold182108_cov51-Attheya_sp.AAC.1
MAMLETITTLTESDEYRDHQSLIPSYQGKEVVLISEEVVARPFVARKYAAAAVVGIPIASPGGRRVQMQIDCAEAAACSSDSSDRSLGKQNSGERRLSGTRHLANMKGLAASEYQEVSENLTRSGQIPKHSTTSQPSNTTMRREFKKGRNARMSGSKSIFWNRHSYFSPSISSRFLFVFNLFLLIGSKLIYADQSDSSADYHDDVCSSGRDGSSEPHN